MAHDYAHLVWRTSDDDGATWSDRNVLMESHRADDPLQVELPAHGRALGRARLLPLRWISYRLAGYEDDGSTTKIWWANGSGGWDGPHDTGVPGIVPDRICELPGGALLLGSHVRDDDTGKLTQMVARSDDGGRTWGAQVTVAAAPGLNLCEGSIICLPGGELVCYMRENSMKGWPLYKAISRDGGESWRGPFNTLVHGGHRPVAGILPGGDVMVTYRYTIGGKPFQAKGSSPTGNRWKVCSARSRTSSSAGSLQSTTTALPGPTPRIPAG